MNRHDDKWISASSVVLCGALQHFSGARASSPVRSEDRGEIREARDGAGLVDEANRTEALYESFR